MNLVNAFIQCFKKNYWFALVKIIIYVSIIIKSIFGVINKCRINIFTSLTVVTAYVDMHRLCVGQ